MPKAIFDQVNLVVADMATTSAFYERLGVDLAPTEPPWDRHHRSAARPTTAGEVDLDIDSATFATRWNEGWPAGGTGVVLGFKLRSREAVDEAYRALTEAGHPGQQRPYDAFWGARYAIVTDPDGNAVGLMSPIDPDRRTEPPSPDGGR